MIGIKGKLILIWVVLALALAACASPPPPEGPAEKLGRAIDQLTQGVHDFGESWDARTEEERKRDEWSERRREYRRRGDDSFSDPSNTDQRTDPQDSSNEWRR
ncbi:MAG: hypothetical protein K1X79_13010 [Oligoflexia bacterium]|nr:hypothetical protein [Oligoflexia bacterium]